MQVGEGACACFWLEPTGDVSVKLRRFTFSEGVEGETKGHRNCPAADHGHDASTGEIARTKLRFKTQPDGYQVMSDVPRRLHPPHKDPRWPKVCAACGEPFHATDQWQVNQAEIYVRSDTGGEVAFRGYADKSMAGALYDAWWLHQRVVKDPQGVERRYVGPDGIALVAICPNGLAWEVDGPASGGGGWTRTGSPKDGTLSVTPSIIAGTPGAEGTYHGWLGVNGAAPSHFSGHLG